MNETPIFKTDFTDFWIILGGVITFLIGPITIKIYALLIIIAIDTLFGLQVAFRENTFSLKIFIRKAFSKLYYYFFYLALFNAIDIILSLPNTMRWFGILIITIVEITSVYHNALKLGRKEASLILEQVIQKLSKDYQISVKSKEDKN